MRHRLSSPLHTTWLVRRSLLALAVAGSVTLLGACSLLPKSWDFWSDPEPEQAAPAPAATPAPVAAPAPPSPGPAPVAEVQTGAVATPVAQPTPAPPMPAAAPPAAAPEPVEKTPPMAPAPQPAKAAALVPGYYINVGLFAVPANGTKAYQKLEAAGLPVFSDPVKKKDVTVTRVRVGPFTTQAKATAAAKKIRALKLEAAVFHHKG